MKEDYVALAFSKCIGRALPCYSRKGNVLMVPIRFIQNVIFPHWELNSLETTLSERMETHTLMSKEVRSLNYWLKSYSYDGIHDQSDNVINGRTQRKYPVLQDGDKGCPIEEAKEFFENCLSIVDKKVNVASTIKTTKEQSSLPQKEPPRLEDRVKFKNTFSEGVADSTKRDSNLTKSSRWDQKPDDLLTSEKENSVTSIDKLIAKQRRIASENQPQEVLEDYSSSDTEHQKSCVNRTTRSNADPVASSPTNETLSSSSSSESSAKRGPRSRIRFSRRESESSSSSSSNASDPDSVSNKKFRRKRKQKRRSLRSKLSGLNNLESNRSSSSSDASVNPTQNSPRFARQRTVTLLKPVRRSHSYSSTSFDSNTDTNSDISEPAVAGNGAFSKRTHSAQIPHSPPRQSTPTSDKPKSPRFPGVQQRVVRRLIGLNMGTSSDESQSEADTSRSTEFDTTSSVKNSAPDNSFNPQQTPNTSSLQPDMISSTSGGALTAANYGQSNTYPFNMMKVPVLLTPWPLIYSGMNQQPPYALPQCQVVPSKQSLPSAMPMLCTQSLPDNSLSTVPSISQPAVLAAPKAEAIQQRQQKLIGNNAGSKRNSSELDNPDADWTQSNDENTRGLLKVNANNNNTSARLAAQVTMFKSQQFVISDDALLCKKPESKVPKRNAANKQQEAAELGAYCIESNSLTAHNGGGGLTAPEAILSASLGSSIAQYSRSVCTDANHKQEKASHRRSSLDSAAYSHSNASADDMLTAGDDAQAADCQKARNRISESFILQSLAKPKSSRQRLVEIVDKLAQESAEFNEVLSDWNIPDYFDRELSVKATSRSDESRTLRMTEFDRSYKHRHFSSQRNTEYERNSRPYNGYRSSSSQERSSKGSSVEKRQVRVAEKASSPVERKLATFVKSSNLSELIISIRQSVQVKEMSSDSSSEHWNSDVEDISDTSLSCSDWETSPLRNTTLDCINADLIGGNAETCSWPFEDESASWDFDVFGILLEIEQKSTKKADVFKVAQPMEVNSQSSTSVKQKLIDVPVSNSLTHTTSPTPVVSRDASFANPIPKKPSTVKQTLLTPSAHIAPKLSKITGFESALQKKLNTPAAKPQGSSVSPKSAQRAKVSRVSLPKGHISKTVTNAGKASSGAIISKENLNQPASGVISNPKPVLQAENSNLAKKTAVPKTGGNTSLAKLSSTISNNTTRLKGPITCAVKQSTTSVTRAMDLGHKSGTTVKAPASSTADAGTTSPSEKRPQHVSIKQPTAIASLTQGSIPFLQATSSHTCNADVTVTQFNIELSDKVERSSAGEVSAISDSVEKVQVYTSTESPNLGQLTSVLKTTLVSASTALKKREQPSSFSEKVPISNSNKVDKRLSMSDKAIVTTSTVSKLPTSECDIHSIQVNIEDVKSAICTAVQKRMKSADLGTDERFKTRKSTVDVLTCPKTAEALPTVKPKSTEVDNKVKLAKSFAAVEEVSSSCTENTIDTIEKLLVPSFNDTRKPKQGLDEDENESKEVESEKLSSGAKSILPNVTSTDNTTTLPTSDVTEQTSTNTPMDYLGNKKVENSAARRETDQTKISDMNGKEEDCSLKLDNFSMETVKGSTETKTEPLVKICPADSTKVIHDPELEQAKDTINKGPCNTTDEPNLLKKGNKEQSVDLEFNLSDANNRFCAFDKTLSNLKAGNQIPISNANCDLSEMQTAIPKVVTKQSWKKKLLEKAIVQSSDLVAVEEINRIRLQLSLNKPKQQSENNDTNLSKEEGPVDSPKTVLSNDAFVEEVHDFSFDSEVKTVEVQTSPVESEELPEKQQSNETSCTMPVDFTQHCRTSIDEDENLNICISDATVEVANSLEIESDIACCLEVQSECLNTVETGSVVKEASAKPPPFKPQPVLHNKINSVSNRFQNTNKTGKEKSKGVKRKSTVIKKSTKGQRPGPVVSTGSAKRAKLPKLSSASNPPSKADCEASSEGNGSFPRLVLTRSNMEELNKAPKPAKTIPTKPLRNQTKQNPQVSKTKSSLVQIAASKSSTSTSTPGNLVTHPSSTTSRNQRPKVIVPTPKSPLSFSKKDPQISATSASIAAPSSHRKNQQVSRPQEVESSTKDEKYPNLPQDSAKTVTPSSKEKRQKVQKSNKADFTTKAFVDDATSTKITLPSNTRPDIISSDPDIVVSTTNQNIQPKQPAVKSNLIETKQLSIVLSDLKTARNCKHEKMYRAATKRKPLPSISSEDEEDTPATDCLLDQASLIAPTIEEDEDDEVVFVSVLSNKNWKETVLGVERTTSDENQDVKKGVEDKTTICDKLYKSEDVKPDIEVKQPFQVVEKSKAKTTDEDLPKKSNKDEVKEVNIVPAELNKASTDVEMPLPEPKTSCIEATFQSRINDDSSKNNGPSKQPLSTNTAELPKVSAANEEQKEASEGCKSTLQLSDSSKNKHDLSVAESVPSLSSTKTASKTVSPNDSSIEKQDLSVTTSKCDPTTTETPSTSSQSSLPSAEKALNQAKPSVKPSTASADPRFQSLNPHSNCYHGIVEVELHAPRKFLKGGKWTHTKKKMFRKRRIAYSQVKLQRNPENCNNCASNSSNLPRHLDVSLLRIRDVAFLLACDVKAFVAYLISQKIRMFRPDPFTRQAYENIYDPVAQTNSQIKSKMGFNEEKPDHDATENQMIYMEDLLRLILPQYFKTHFNIESKQLPQFVSVKTYQPINYLNQDVIKMFAESFAFNQFLFNQDVDLKTEPPKQKRKRKSKDPTSVGTDVKQAKVAKVAQGPKPASSINQVARSPVKNPHIEAGDIPSSSSQPGVPIADTENMVLNAEVQQDLSRKQNPVGASLPIAPTQSGSLNQSLSPQTTVPIPNTAVANQAGPSPSQLLLTYLAGSTANSNLQGANFSATPRYQAAALNQFAPKPFVTLKSQQGDGSQPQLAGFPPYNVQHPYSPQPFQSAEMHTPPLPYAPYQNPLQFAANAHLIGGQATVQHQSAHQYGYEADQEQFRLATMGVHPSLALQHLRQQSDSPFSAGSRRSSTESLSLGAKFVHGNAPTPPTQTNNEHDVEMRMKALLFTIQQDEQLQNVEAALVEQQQPQLVQPLGLANHNLVPIQPKQSHLFRPHEHQFNGNPIHMNLNGNNNTILGPNPLPVGGFPRPASDPALIVLSRDPVTSDGAVSKADSPRGFTSSSDATTAPENGVLAISSVYSLNESESGLKTTSEFLTKTAEENAEDDLDQNEEQDSNSVSAKIEGLVRLLRPDGDLGTC